MIYTKTGDDGTTSLVGGIRVSKTDARLQAYGTIDELNAFLGLLKSKIEPEERDFLHSIQNTLMCIGANLATDKKCTELPDSAKINAEKTTILEQKIDEIDKKLPKLTQFIVYGDDELSALCHVCRAIARRAEREILIVDNQDVTDCEIKKYINRLSDFLFVFARFLALKNKKNEKYWAKN